MKLYYAPGTCALACWIALEWVGADYRVERVDPASEAYRAVHPLGMVPAIDLGAGRPMTQADAILTYIVERFPGHDLGADEGLRERLEFHEAMSFLTGDFHPAFWPYFAPARFTVAEDRAGRAAVREAAHARVERVMTHLDRMIGATGHVYRDKRTVADAYAFVMTRWTRRFPRPWSDYASIAPFMQAMEADPVVADVLERSRR